MTVNDPTDWDTAYVRGTTGWDLGAPLAYIEENAALFGEPGTAFAPGAGRGHDAAGLAAAGWRTTVIDLSPTAAAYAAEHYPDITYAVGDALDAEVVLAATGGPVDLMWDHTFFCALPPDWRGRVGDLARAVVRPGGRVASGIFPIDRPRTEAGPPWTYVPEDMSRALCPDFDLVHVSEPRRLNPRMPWSHRLGIWQRRLTVHAAASRHSTPSV
jgi:hypothetical protein